MVQAGKLILPLIMWSPKAPHLSISTVTHSTDLQLIVYGTTSGHIALVHYEDSNTPDAAEPFAIIEAHADIVHSIALYQEAPNGSWYFSSSCEDGDLVTWRLDTFTSVKHRKFNFTTTKVQAFACSPSGSIRLFCSGNFLDMRVIDPVSLVILFNLTSRLSPDWVSAFTVFHLASKRENVVVAITQSAVAKVWTFGDNIAADAILENESKSIRACHIVDLVCCPQSRRTALVVCSKYWQVYDLSDFSTLCHQTVPSDGLSSRGERWIGGVFLNLSSVLIWSSSGMAYVYRLPSNSVAGHDSFHTVAPDQVASPDLLFKYSSYNASDSISSTPTTTCMAMSYCPRSRLLVCGDSVGRLLAWRIAAVDNKTCPSASATTVTTLPLWSSCLADAWAKYKNQLVRADSDPNQQWSWFGASTANVTVSVFIGESQRLVCGLDDGRIAICPAIELLYDFLLSKSKQGPEHLQMLEGHAPSRVTALLYPYADDTRYDPDQLLSGGADFAVCVWSIRQGSRLHRFTVQAGEILRLLVTPSNCTVLRLLSCVCSIASDNSVALLNVKEQRCHLLASQHPYPVSLIRWRPSHDFMLVRLTNGDVYVWEMETGHLDRVVSSIKAEAVLAACDMDTTPGTVDVIMQSRKKNRHIMNQLHRRLKSNNPHSSTSPLPSVGGGRGSSVHPTSPQSHAGFKLPTNPLHIQPLHLSLTSYAADALVVYIDIETLIITLAVERLLPNAASRSAENPPSSSARQQFQVVGSPAVHSSTDPVTSCEPTRLLHLMISILHAWGLNPDLDTQLTSRLKIKPPPEKTCFGAVVSGQLFALVPGWLQVLAKRTASLRSKQAPSAVPTSLNPFAEELAAAASTTKPEAWALRCYWATGALLTATRLLPMVSLANAVARLEQVAPPLPQRPQTGGPAPPRPPPPGSGRKATAAGQETQMWLQVCTMYTVLLPELVGPYYQPPPLQTLANRFHDQCLAIRDSAQSLLSAELSRIGSNGRKALVNLWTPYLPQPPAPSANSPAAKSPSYLAGSETMDDLQELICPPTVINVPQSAQTPQSQSFLTRQFDTSDLRRLQATAVVLLSIIGTDFGQAVVSPVKKEAQVVTNQPPAVAAADGSKAFAEGFSVSDGMLAQATACALAHLVSANSEQLNALAAVRRAAAALVGRGFAIWEPYLDISQVLLALLALCPAAASENSAWSAFLNSSENHNALGSFIALSPAADASRTARHSLSLIATGRPKPFIVSIATEVRRFYNSLASSPSSLANITGQPPPPATLLGGAFGTASSAISTNTNANQFASDPKSPAALLWARGDILRLLDVLAERYPADVSDLLLEAVDIAVFCLDPSALRGRQLVDFIPHLARVSSVAFCIHSQRIAVGGRTGLLVFYEPPKSVSAPGGPWARFASQAVNAHAGQPVTELLFSPDGRHLASYSAGHRKISFWQPASSSLFSSSSSQLMKLVRSVAAPAASLEKVAAAQRALPRLLFWSDRSTLHLRLGTEQGDEFNFSL